MQKRPIEEQMDSHSQQEMDPSKILYFSNRVTKSLKEMMHYPLTIVEAPMGYGKSTAVREYLKNEDARVFTLRLFDSSRSAFWSALCALISKYHSEVGAQLNQLGFPDESIMVYDAISKIEEIAFPKKSVLMIDDYHLIDSPEVNFFIESLIKCEIENLHIVMTTRYISLNNLEELKLKGYIHHLTKDVLELQPNEIGQYYKLCGIKLSDRETDQLFSYTEGWISALYLLLLNHSEKAAIGKINSIYKLVESAIYEPCTEELKLFLLSIGIFNRFTLEQAMFMWNHSTAHDSKVVHFIDEITKKNAFICYDSVAKLYSNHHILSHFLTNKLENSPYKNEIYQKAGLWHQSLNEYATAMHYFALCGHYDLLLQTLILDKSSSFNGDNQEVLIEYMESCPSDVKFQYPLAMLIYAMHLFTFNKIELFGKTCGEIAELIETDASLSDEERQSYMGEFELIMSFTEYNNIQKMAAHHKNACALMNKTTQIYDTSHKWTFGSFSVLYMFYRESGKLEEHVQDVLECMPYYYQLTDFHGSGGEFLFEAERYFYMGDYENATISMHKALNRAQSKAEIDIILGSEFLQIRLELMKGKSDHVLEKLSSMRKDAKYSLDYFYLHTIELGEAYIYGLLGHLDKIPERVADGHIHTSRLMFPAHGLIHIAHGRALLVKGAYLELIGKSEEYMEFASVFPNLLVQIHTNIYLAAAYYKINRVKEAKESLKKALDVALPDQLFMPFVENCDYIEILLKDFEHSGVYRDQIAKIMKLHTSYSLSKKQLISYLSQNTKVKLSKREREIAELAAEGYTNKEISEKLYISQNTIKTQLKAVFEKLEINSRALLKQALYQNHPLGDM